MSAIENRFVLDKWATLADKLIFSIYLSSDKWTNLRFPHPCLNNILDEFEYGWDQVKK